MAEFLHENAGRLLVLAAFVIYAFRAWDSRGRALGASKTGAVAIMAGNRRHASQPARSLCK